MIAVPPVLHALGTLAGGLTDDLVERFLSVPEAHREPTRRIEFLSQLHLFSGTHADQTAGHAHELLFDLQLKRNSDHRSRLAL